MKRNLKFECLCRCPGRQSSASFYQKPEHYLTSYHIYDRTWTELKNMFTFKTHKTQLSIYIEQHQSFNHQYCMLYVGGVLIVSITCSRDFPSFAASNEYKAAILSLPVLIQPALKLKISRPNKKQKNCNVRTVTYLNSLEKR